MRVQRIFVLVCSIGIVLASSGCAHQTPSPNTSIRPSATTLAADAAAGGNEAIAAVIEAERVLAAEAARKTAAANEFMGLQWGMGLAGIYDLDGGRVESARIVNGIVRVEDERDFDPRILLELHDFGWLPWVTEPDPELLWGSGPWIGIQSSSEQVIDSFALGWMIGKRKSNTATSSFNVGLGLVFDPTVKVLGAGFEADQPAPAGEVEVRFRTETHKGVGVVFSASF